MLERTYVIPLRREWLKVPKYKRAKKAVTAVREFLERHMKSDDVRLGRMLNLEIWKKGIKNPPSRVKISAKKYDDNLVRAELFGHKIEEPKKEEPKKKGIAGKLAEKLGGGEKKESKTSKESEKPEVEESEEKIGAELKKLEEKTKAVKEELSAKKSEDKPAPVEKKEAEKKEAKPVEEKKQAEENKTEEKETKPVEKKEDGIETKK